MSAGNSVPAHFEGFPGHFGGFMDAEMRAFPCPRAPGRALRLFQNEESGGFVMPENVRKSSRFSAVRASRGYNGAALVVQRRPRELAVRAPLQPREALTAKQCATNYCTLQSFYP